MSNLHPTVARITDRIVARSAPGRRRYLDLMDREGDAHARRTRGMGCANLAHAFAAAGDDKPAMLAGTAPNLALVTAYNDMLSAHQPYARYPEAMKVYAREVGATAQVAGGVPAMCDGVTQGYEGMELSLFSRDTIALATAVAMSHAVFDGMALLGVRISEDFRKGFASKKSTATPHGYRAPHRGPAPTRLLHAECRIPT